MKLTSLLNGRLSIVATYRSSVSSVLLLLERTCNIFPFCFELLFEMITAVKIPIDCDRHAYLLVL